MVVSCVSYFLFVCFFVKASRGICCCHDAGVCSTGQTTVQGEGSRSFKETITGLPGIWLMLFLFLLLNFISI